MLSVEKAQVEFKSSHWLPHITPTDGEDTNAELPAREGSVTSELTIFPYWDKASPPPSIPCSSAHPHSQY